MKVNFASSLAHVLQSEGGLTNSRQCVLKGKSTLSDLMVERLVVDADSAGEVLKRHSFSTMFYPNGPAAIVRLLLCGRPSAVIRRVGAVHINSVQGHAHRWFTHVSKKVVEAIEPATTHRYSSPAVILESCIRRVLATPLCRLPHPIGPTYLSRSGVSVSRIGLRGPVSSQAAATVRPTSHCRAVNQAFCSTIAAAQPSNPTAITRTFGATDGCQTTVAQSGSVNKPRHLLRLPKYDLAVKTEQVIS